MSAPPPNTTNEDSTRGGPGLEKRTKPDTSTPASDRPRTRGNDLLKGQKLPGRTASDAQTGETRGKPTPEKPGAGEASREPAQEKPRAGETGSKPAQEKSGDAMQAATAPPPPAAKTPPSTHGLLARRLEVAKDAAEKGTEKEGEGEAAIREAQVGMGTGVPQVAARDSIDPGQAHVLVVEDNVPNFVLIARLLAYTGVQRCEWKTSGWQVVEFADTLSRIDLILMDIRLPYEDGFQALKKVRSHPRFKNTLVVAVTAEATAEQMRRAKEAGFDGFLGKPLNPDKFPNQVRRMLSGQPVWEIQ